MKAKLERFVRTSHGTFGRLTVGHRVFLTMEEEWQNNKQSVSCIPAGTYTCKRSRYHKGGYDTFEITGVPNRSRILFHAANTEEDVEGCVGIGSTLHVFDVIDEDLNRRVPKLGISGSKAAFSDFMDITKGVSEFPLTIQDPLA